MAIHSVLGLALSETKFQSEVIKAAKRFGYLHYHTHDSRRSPSGFPDLVLAKNGAVLFAELKTDTAVVDNDDQIKWLHATYGAIWRPKHWEIILKSMQDGRTYETEPIPQIR